MDFQRTWANADCAAGFAAACTKLSYIAGNGSTHTGLDIHSAAVGAIRAAENAKAMQLNKAPADSWITQASNAANKVANAAMGGRACHTELAKLYVQWALKDLIGDRVVDVLMRQAAGAAILGGSEEIAVELLS